VDNSRVEEFLQKNIEASNRTTHAVRAFVSFVLIQLAFGTIAAILSLIATANSITWLIWVAVLIWVVGVFLSSNAAWGELNASEIPSSYVPSSGRSRASNSTAGVSSKATKDQDKVPRNLKLDSNMRLVCKTCGNWELIENGRCTACN